MGLLGFGGVFVGGAVLFPVLLQAPHELEVLLAPLYLRRPVQGLLGRAVLELAGDEGLPQLLGDPGLVVLLDHVAVPLLLLHLVEQRLVALVLATELLLLLEVELGLEADIDGLVGDDDA